MAEGHVIAWPRLHHHISKLFNRRGRPISSEFIYYNRSTRNK